VRPLLSILRLTHFEWNLSDFLFVGPLQILLFANHVRQQHINLYTQTYFLLECVGRSMTPSHSSVLHVSVDRGPSPNQCVAKKNIY
jgi:hypothetical protein